MSGPAVPLSEIFAGYGGPLSTSGELFENRITCDVREVKPGDIFVAADFPWLRRPGRCAGAMARGARCLVLGDGNPEQKAVLRNTAVDHVVVEDVNRSYARLCARRFLERHKTLRLVAVTGTKGKTTLCHLIGGILQTLGCKVAVTSTLGYMRDGGDLAKMTLTTPMPYELHRLFYDASEAGCRFCVIEASSIGIAEGRLSECSFEVVGLTNIDLDHRDYHGDFETYRKTKVCFVRKNGDTKVLCADDGHCRRLATELREQGLRTRTYGYGCGTSADVVARVNSVSRSGASLSLRNETFPSMVPGEHHAQNLAGAVAIVEALGVQCTGEALRAVGMQRLPGRQEVVSTDLAVTVLVDSAHTPGSAEALLRVYSSPPWPKPLVVVLGCAGDRDTEKRSVMAAIVERYADIGIFTADNPRSENPESILDDMIVGIVGTDARILRIPNRGEAIREGLASAMPNGMLLVLGRGDETHQEIAGRRIPFDDRLVVQRCAREIIVEGG